MTVREMVRGLVRAAEFKEQEDGDRIWDEKCRLALEEARSRGWGRDRVGSLVESADALVALREELRDLAQRAMKLSAEPGAEPGTWEIQTSNSFRRIGTARGDGDVLCAITQRSDNHPDLLAPAGVLDYIVAAQPRTVLALLDLVDQLERYIVERADREGLFKAGVAQVLMDFADKSQRGVIDFADKLQRDVLELVESQIERLLTIGQIEDKQDEVPR